MYKRFQEEKEEYMIEQDMTLILQIILVIGLINYSVFLCIF